MKTKFELERGKSYSKATIEIIGSKPNGLPYVGIWFTDSLTHQEHSFFIPDKDVKRFSKNLNKALGL